MATFQRVPREEAQRLVMPTKKAAHEEYVTFVRQLTPGVAGRLELEETDKPTSVRAQLKRAARQEGLELTIQRQERALLFWVEALEGDALTPQEEVAV